MREAGDVCFADVYKDGTGVVEFLRAEDMRYAIKKLDDSRFRSHEGEVAYIRIREDGGLPYGEERERKDYRDGWEKKILESQKNSSMLTCFPILEVSNLAPDRPSRVEAVGHQFTAISDLAPLEAAHDPSTTN